MDIATYRYRGHDTLSFSVSPLIIQRSGGLLSGLKYDFSSYLPVEKAKKLTHLDLQSGGIVKAFWRVICSICQSVLSVLSVLCFMWYLFYMSCLFYLCFISLFCLFYLFCVLCGMCLICLVWFICAQDKAEDIRTLVDSFTAPALAAALRDRETALHTCAHLLEKVQKTVLSLFDEAFGIFFFFLTQEPLIMTKFILREWYPRVVVKKVPAEEMSWKSNQRIQLLYKKKHVHSRHRTHQPGRVSCFLASCDLFCVFVRDY